MADRFAIRALVLDFDGLILDTESSVFEAWRWIYADHGHELSLERWQATIGTDGSSHDPLADLRAMVGDELDVEGLHRRRRDYRDQMLAEQEVMPGVVSWLEQARGREIGLAIASSSDREWVSGHIERLGLLEYFDEITTRDEVDAAKPAPDLYLRATSRLDVEPAEAIALEDSPNGVRAAKAAGLYCVAVPGPMTQTLSFEEADIVLPSLEARSLGDWLREIGRDR